MCFENSHSSIYHARCSAPFLQEEELDAREHELLDGIGEMEAELATDSLSI